MKHVSYEPMKSNIPGKLILTCKINILSFLSNAILTNGNQSKIVVFD